ncbi:type II toxin-antitoxin system VapC family toxin [Dietzia timorensis]|uniref:Ribonuclease VapC n=1 Tax=Dietzia timorensis TaxID=499555 RepID=A0A173LRE3_9ACTN|nr:type II toxin-antitoxin system VapC family toxin [Dietzia timorensis]ANI93612.1 putative VapC ribonuclease Y4jK [Dietzia timorensis]
MSESPRALLDTNILIAQFSPESPRPDLTKFDDLYVSSLSYSELRFGLSVALQRSPKEYILRRNRLESVEHVFGSGLPFDDSAAEAYSEIMDFLATRTPHKQSLKAHVLDRMIAATALAHNLVLVTRNVGDFRALEGLLDVIEC